MASIHGLPRRVVFSEINSKDRGISATVLLFMLSNRNENTSALGERFVSVRKLLLQKRFCYQRPLRAWGASHNTLSKPLIGHSSSFHPSNSAAGRGTRFSEFFEVIVHPLAQLQRRFPYCFLLSVLGPLLGL